MNSDLFYKHYDNLYSGKDYALEAQTVLAIVKKYYSGRIQRVLEIGCGTGNHTLELAGQNFLLTAIDTDRKMVEIASQKVDGKKYPRVKLVRTTIEELEESNFDFAMAGFNVVNYIPDFNKLDTFFNAVNMRLRDEGLFIFDCWNGVAALMDPPKTKTIEWKNDELSLVCNISSQTDFIKQKTNLTYNLSIRNAAGLEIDSGIFCFEQMLWTPMELSHLLCNAGFEILFFCRPFQHETIACERDWKVMFICQKK